MGEFGNHLSLLLVDVIEEEREPIYLSPDMVKSNLFLVLKA
jgi:hypothetical protein